MSNRKRCVNTVSAYRRPFAAKVSIPVGCGRFFLLVSPLPNLSRPLPQNDEAAAERRPGLRELGRRLSTMRQARGLTQAELAKRIGCSTNSVSRWENASQEMGVLDAAAIADVLDSTVQDLVDPRPSLRLLRDSPLCFLSPLRIERIRSAGGNTYAQPQALRNAQQRREPAVARRLDEDPGRGAGAPRHRLERDEVDGDVDGAVSRLLDQPPQ